MIVATGEATAKATHNTGATAKKLTAESTPDINIYRPIIAIDSQQTPKL